MFTVSATFADASAEWLRYVEHDRDVKPSTLSDYWHMARRLDRTFGELPLGRIAREELERWRAGMSCSNRTTQKYLIVLNGMLLALRWQEVDFAAETIRVVRGFTIGGESSPKSGKPRSVPMIGEVATVLARIGDRDHFRRDGDLVFAGAAGGHLDSKDVRAAYKAALARAGLRELRFHDLRHTFGTRAVEQADSILELEEWMATCKRPNHDALSALQVKGRC